MLSKLKICPFSTFLLLLFAVCVGIESADAGQTNVELVIDDSGSMAQHVSGGRKIDVAKQVFSGFVQDLPSDAQVAVRTYGRRQPSNKRDCSDMELLTPFGPNSAQRVLPGVNSLRPNGMTPIAASLQAAAGDFAGKEGQNNIIVLLTDGEEDCNGDPCAAAKAAHDAGVHLQINVIGFNVKNTERSQLRCIAKAGGGNYYDAHDAAELKVATSEVKQTIVAPTPAPPPPSPSATPTPYVKAEEPLDGDPIHGGDSYAQALPIPVGKLFHLDHPQPMSHYDFFSLAVRGGQSIAVTVTRSKTPGTQPGAKITDSNHQTLAYGDVGTGNKVIVQRDFADQQDENYYVLIGSDYGREEERDTFQVDLVNNYDADSDRDAGADESRALEIKPGTYPHNYLSDVDKVDVFKFKAGGGKSYQFKARPAKADGSIDLSAVNDDGVALGSASSPNKGAVATLDGLKLTKDGYIYVKVQFGEWSSHTGHYGIALGEGQVDSPHPPPEQ